MNDDNGFTAPPARYTRQGRETIDRQRDRAHAVARRLLDHGDLTEQQLADALFGYHCDVAAMKYEDRDGSKGDVDGDAAKARWYRGMQRHVEEGGPDPRSERPGFTPYQRPNVVQVRLLSDQGMPLFGGSQVDCGICGGEAFFGDGDPGWEGDPVICSACGAVGALMVDGCDPPLAAGLSLDNGTVDVSFEMWERGAREEWPPDRAHWFGPGGAWTIMARPRSWERGMGVFPALVPDAQALEAVRAGNLSPEDYMATCMTAFVMQDLRPEILTTFHGATLCCSCSPFGPCHRRPAALALAFAGWRVVLDGEAFEVGDDHHARFRAANESIRQEFGQYPSVRFDADRRGRAEVWTAYILGVGRGDAATPAEAVERMLARLRERSDVG